MSDDRWENNELQFARLLGEIEAAVEEVPIADLALSMDLTLSEVTELFARAAEVVEAYKSQVVPTDVWVRFTKRTNDPKLRWLERQLTVAGIRHRRNGYSFHAPILEVPEHQEDAAWAILRPVDEVDDDDERFNP